MKNEQKTWRVNHLIYAAGEDLHSTIRTRIALTEPIRPDALRQAADSAITRYPYFSVRLVRDGEAYKLAYNGAPLPITPGGKAIPLGALKAGAICLPWPMTAICCMWIPPIF